MANLIRDRHNRRLRGSGDRLCIIVLKETKKILEALAAARECAVGAVVDNLILEKHSEISPK